MSIADNNELETCEEEIARLQAKSLRAVGCAIASEFKYRSVDGIEAAQLYLINKHGWLPSQVKGMNHEDLLFALSEWELDF